GSASSAKVAYFSDRKCRIEFVDLLGELDPALLHEDAEPLDLGKAIESLLGGSDRRIDIALFWDVLNYLPAHAVNAVQNCLAKQLHPESRAHCFSIRHTETPIPWAEHAFESGDQIVSKTKTSDPWQTTPHTPSALNRLLPCLHVDRAILLRNERLELLLTPHSD
ncbi:MAG: hypothetical protein AB8B93_20260, partial [Pseudomonadales bacterium]